MQETQRPRILSGEQIQSRLTSHPDCVSHEHDSFSWGRTPLWKAWSPRHVWHKEGSKSGSPGGMCTAEGPMYFRLGLGCLSTLTMGLLIHLRTYKVPKKRKSKCILPPLVFHEVSVGNMVGWTLMKGGSQFLHLSSLNVTWINQGWSLTFQECFFFDQSFHLAESLSPSAKLENNSSFQAVVWILKYFCMSKCFAWYIVLELILLQLFFSLSLFFFFFF